jgi:hypothetical protein
MGPYRGAICTRQPSPNPTLLYRHVRAGREYPRKSSQSPTKGSTVPLREPQSVNDIRTAIRELSTRADLARKQGRSADAAELDKRVRNYRDELGSRP